MKIKLLFILLLAASILFLDGFHAYGKKSPSGIIPAEILVDSIIADAGYTFEEAVSGKDIPANILKNLRLVEVEYFSFDDKLHRGQLIIHKDLVKDIELIFKELKKEKFPIAKVIPIVRYNWNDEKSMRDNNTSAFNYRVVKGTRILSAHSTGRAIDINPLFNPQIKKGKVIPKGAEYDPGRIGTISGKSAVVNHFKKRGWIWGGNWRSTKDYQHFEKK